MALCLSSLAWGQSLSGRVVRVVDGDTLEMRSSTDTVKVRLAHIDAPEKGQPFNQRAKETLARLCAGQQAWLQQTDTDRYGRRVGEVTCQGRNANQVLLHEGMAWVYPKYTPNNHPFYGEEQAARTDRRGLWADPAPMPPWEWRRLKRSGH